MPPMTAAKKITTAPKSNPVTIFLFRVALGNRRRGSNLEDRIHPTLNAPARIASRRSTNAATSSINHNALPIPTAIVGEVRSVLWTRE
jgi:hypothetical protein